MVFKKHLIPWNKGKKIPVSEKLQRHLYLLHLSMRDRIVSEETRKKLSISSKGRVFSQETLKKMNENRKGMLGKHHTDETKIKISVAKKGISRSEETCRKLSESRIGMKLSEEHKRKIGVSETGDKHWNWQGGIGKDPYPQGWTKTLKRAIRERDNYTCQLCGGGGSDVHHIDYDKNNLNPNNLILLCHKDHTRTTGHRKEWIESFSAILEERR